MNKKTILGLLVTLLVLALVPCVGMRIIAESKA